MIEHKETIIKKEVARYKAIAVPTQHTIAIQTPNQETIEIAEGIAEILNGIEDLKRNLLGQ